MKKTAALELRDGLGDAHCFVDETWPLNPLERRSVQLWRALGRITLLGLLAYSVLQYYFFDVYLAIIGMPRLTPLAAH